MKNYTDLELSKKLAEILPLESADMTYRPIMDIDSMSNSGFLKIPDCYPFNEFKDSNIKPLPCWSLTALLSVLPYHLIVNNQRYVFSMHKGLNKDGETYTIRYNISNTDICIYSTKYYNNPIDACVEMIVKLHELNLL